MRKENLVVYAPKALIEVGWSIAFFPVWWYTKGLLMALKNIRSMLRDQMKSTALLVWIRNIFVPMYGQHDWAGILISLIVRLFQIIVRGSYMLIWLIIAILLLLAWLSLPVFVIYEIYLQIL
jgi:hypothetical protein